MSVREIACPVCRQPYVSWESANRCATTHKGGRRPKRILTLKEIAERKEKNAVRHRAYYWNNREKVLEKDREYYWNNRERVIARCVAYTKRRRAGQ